MDECCEFGCCAACEMKHGMADKRELAMETEKLAMA